MSAMEKDADGKPTAGIDSLRRLFRLERGKTAGREEIQALLPSGVSTFYREALNHPDLAPHFASSDVEALKKKQEAHWRNLLDDAKFEQAMTDALHVGRVHANREIVPATYMAGYAIILEDLIGKLVDRRMKGATRTGAIGLLIRACFADMAASVTAYSGSMEDATAQDRLLSMSDSLDREMSVTLSEVRHQVDTLAQLARRLDEASAEVSAATDQVSASADSMRGSVNTVAGAAQELEASSQEITSQAEGASQQAEQTRGDVERAREAMVRLNESARAIEDVTALVQRIAAQTRMLALNATIEAARAGEAGRGFAVVANEVKSLASETEKAIASVSERTEQIGRATGEVDGALEGIVGSIGDLSDRSGAIAASAAEQRAATGEIAESAQQASGETSQVAEQLQTVQHVARLSTQTSERLSDISGRLARDTGDLQRRVRIMLRASDAGNRRQHERVAVGIPATLTLNNQRHEGHITDLSTSGALFFPGVGDEDKIGGQRGVLNSELCGSLGIEVIAGSGLGVHTRFVDNKSQALERVIAVLARAKAEDEPLIELCRNGAGQLSRVLESALGQGRITEIDLFADHYEPIPDTDPQQYMTPFVPLTDAEFPAIQEPIVRRHQDIVFCAAVDRNAFLPTHNEQFSKPQRQGDVVWNTANSRNRRIFDDRAGLLGARNADPHRVQSYVRDMGGGNKQVLKEIDCPITVRGRIWGNLRLAYRQDLS